MLSFTGAAFKLYRNTLSATSTAGVITDLLTWIKESFSSSSKIPACVLHKLEVLARRIAVLSPLLNYCLLYSQSRNSVSSDAVHQTKEVIRQVHTFLVQSNRQHKLQDSSYVIPFLDEHIKELEFCTTALNLALTIIQVSTKENEMVVLRESDEKADEKMEVSLSCLLKASSRIVERHLQGGDLCDNLGTLFRYEPKSQIIPWAVVYEKAVLKVFRNRERKVYEVIVENARDSNLTNLKPLSGGGASFRDRRRKPLRWELSSSLALSCTNENTLGLKLPKKHEVEEMGVNNCFTWIHKIANNVKNTFAFVVTNDVERWESGETTLTEEGDEWNLPEAIPHVDTGSSQRCSPMLFSYIARLCVFENDGSRAGVSSKSYNNLSQGTGKIRPTSTPLHLSARDEEFSMILRNPAVKPFQVPSEHLGDSSREETDEFSRDDFVITPHSYAENRRTKRGSSTRRSSSQPGHRVVLRGSGKNVGGPTLPRGFEGSLVIDQANEYVTRMGVEDSLEDDLTIIRPLKEDALL